MTCCGSREGVSGSVCSCQSDDMDWGRQGFNIRQDDTFFVSAGPEFAGWKAGYGPECDRGVSGGRRGECGASCGGSSVPTECGLADSEALVVGEIGGHVNTWMSAGDESPLVASEADESVVVIQTFRKPRCGPDVTDWLVDQIDDALRNSDITTTVPHPGISSAARWGDSMLKFMSQVKAGSIYDFKSYITFESGDCPKPPCEGTVTFCGTCQASDIVGNVFFGMLGSASGFPAKVLHAGADYAQAGGVDDPHDAAAIDVGVEAMRETWWNPRFRAAAMRSKDPAKFQKDGVRAALCAAAEQAGKALEAPWKAETLAQCPPCPSPFTKDPKKLYQEHSHKEALRKALEAYAQWAEERDRRGWR